MSRESEKAMKKMHEFLEQHATQDMSTEQINALLQEFTQHYNDNLPEPVTEKTARTADDYLELAQEAEEDDQIANALKYAKKALKLDPDNLDAELLVAQYGASDPVDLLKKVERVLSHGDQLMKREGFMEEENIGHFWGILETRPYMRLKGTYMHILVECGMTGKAVREGEEMIRLCENDNPGVRYTLMHLYALLDREEDALALHRKYDGQEETQMLLPLSILYFKKGDLSAAEKYLRKLAKVNKDTAKFFKAFREDNLEKYLDDMSGYGYRPFTIEELAVEMMENEFLFRFVPAYFIWAQEQLKRRR